MSESSGQPPALPPRSWMDWYRDVASALGTVEPSDFVTMLEQLLGSATWTAHPEETEIYPFLALCWPHAACRIQIHAAMQMWSKAHRADFVNHIKAHLPTPQARHAVSLASKPLNGTSASVDPERSMQGIPDTSYGDVFNAEALVLRYGEELRYCKEWHTWFLWKGTHWAKDREDAIYDYARDTLTHLGHAALDSDTPALMKHVMKSRSSPGLHNMVTQASTMQPIRQLPEAFDQHQWLLNCTNGTVDLRSGDIREPDPADLITKCTAAAYNPEASCPGWTAFIEQIMGLTHEPDSPDDSMATLEANAERDIEATDLVNFLWRATGYSLVGSTQEKVLLLPWGAGDNGKSTFIETFADVLGPDYAMRTPAGLFLAKNEGAIPNDVAQLKGMRFAYAAEPPQGRRLDASLVKDLTGGDTVSARFMRGEFFSFRPECTLWMSTNHRPPTRDTGNALWNRLKLIPFTVTIPKEQQDGQLRQKLLQEADGILTWAIRGCLDWQRHGLQEPEVIRAATEAYRTENDTLALFLQDCCLIDPRVQTKSSMLYDAYKKWCEENGETFITQKSFSIALEEKGYAKEKKGVVWWLGLGLQTSE